MMTRTAWWTPARRLRRSLLALMIMAWPTSLVAQTPDVRTPPGIDKLVLIQRHAIECTHVYTYHIEGFRPGGGLFVRSGDGSLQKLVDSPQGQILDCDVSFDGREILFSWRKTRETGYHLFVIHADGTGLTQLTDGPWHDYNAAFLPDGGIVFLSTREVRFAYCWVSPVGVLHRMERDGSHVRRLSANIVNDFTPSVMDDGRIIYSRWEYVDKPAIPIQSLWTLKPDGTGLAGFYGNRVLSPATMMEARSIPGTSSVLCTLTSHNGPARGGLGIIDRRRGDNAPEALRNLTPEVDLGRPDDAGRGNGIRGPWQNPFPVCSTHYLCSRDGTVMLRDFAGQEQVVVQSPRDRMGFYSPQPLKPRARPPVIPAGYTEGTDATATVFLQDISPTSGL